MNITGGNVRHFEIGPLVYSDTALSILKLSKACLLVNLIDVFCGMSASACPPLTEVLYVLIELHTCSLYHYVSLFDIELSIYQ